MLSQFNSMWDGHPSRINNAKERIERLQLEKDPVHSEPYRAGSMTREFEKVQIKKMLPKNIIEPLQTERTKKQIYPSPRRTKLRILRRLPQADRRD